MRAVFHEIQLLGDLVGYEIDAFRCTEIAFFLLVSFPAPMYAGKLSDNGGYAVAPFQLKEEFSGFVGHEEELGGQGRQAGCPAGGGNGGDKQADQQKKDDPEQERPLGAFRVIYMLSPGNGQLLRRGKIHAHDLHSG